MNIYFDIQYRVECLFNLRIQVKLTGTLPLGQDLEFISGSGSDRWRRWKAWVTVYFGEPSLRLGGVQLTLVFVALSVSFFTRFIFILIKSNERYFCDRIDSGKVLRNHVISLLMVVIVLCVDITCKRLSSHFNSCYYSHILLPESCLGDHLGTDSSYTETDCDR